MKPSSLSALRLKTHGPQENVHPPGSTGSERSTVRMTSIDSNRVLFRIVPVKSLCVKAHKPAITGLEWRGQNDYNIDLQKDFLKPSLLKENKFTFFSSSGETHSLYYGLIFYAPKSKLTWRSSSILREIFWWGWLELIDTLVLYFNSYLSLSSSSELIFQNWYSEGKKSLSLNNSLNFYYVKNSTIFYSQNCFDLISLCWPNILTQSLFMNFSRKRKSSHS